MTRMMIALLLATTAGLASAQATPVGLWKTIDDDGKTEKSLVRLTESAGVITGKIEKISDPAKQDSKCDKCTDARKDKPVLGMQIIDGMKKDSNENHWEGGQILDPNNGKVYRLRLAPKDGGKVLEVRGYIGPFFRNQTWIRVE